MSAVSVAPLLLQAVGGGSYHECCVRGEHRGERQIVLPQPLLPPRPKSFVVFLDPPLLQFVFGADGAERHPLLGPHICRVSGRHLRGR